MRVTIHLSPNPGALNRLIEQCANKHVGLIEINTHENTVTFPRIAEVVDGRGVTLHGKTFGVSVHVDGHDVLSIRCQEEPKDGDR